MKDILDRFAATHVEIFERIKEVKRKYVIVLCFGMIPLSTNGHSLIAQKAMLLRVLFVVCINQ